MAAPLAKDTMKLCNYTVNNTALMICCVVDMINLCTGPQEWVGYNNYKLTSNHDGCHDMGLLMCKERCLEMNACRSITYNSGSSTCCLHHVNQWQVALVAQTGLDYYEYFNTITGKLFMLHWCINTSFYIRNWTKILIFSASVTKWPPGNSLMKQTHPKKRTNNHLYK